MRVIVELELEAYEDGSAHPLEYFKKDLEEFFEQYGWYLTYSNFDDIKEE